MIGYHGTDAEFDRFDERMFGSKENFSPNGALGVWVYLFEDLARNHGRRTLRVDADISHAIRIGVGQMQRDHHEAGGDRHEALAYFAAKRAALLAEGYQAIEVEEANGSVMIAVILDPDRILSVSELPAAPSLP
jgi:hypothetical protein